MNIDEFVDINKLKPVTSWVMLQRGNTPHPDGLLSNEIFGITPKDRKNTFAYIDLGHVFFNPHVYKIIMRFFRNVEKVINGTLYYKIDSEGHLILSDEVHGKTGIQFLYDNWNKIKWEYTDSTARNERIDVITKCKKNEIFLTKFPVIPPFYRDVAGGSGGGNTVVPINTFYTSLIRYASILKENDSFDFSLYSTQASIQNTLVEAYDYFKQKLEKKNGMLRRYLMGKNTDFTTRTVITATPFHANVAEDMQVNMEYTGIPISQILSLCNPFIMAYLKSFFERNIINDPTLYYVKNNNTTDVVEVKSPELIFTQKFLEKKMNSFIKDPDTRFEPIEVPLTNGKTMYLKFTGKRTDLSSTDEIASISNRRMTWTDLFYMACYDAVKDKHCIITRYPLLDQYGLFTSRISVLSTSRTVPMQVGETLYKYYPDIDPNLPKSKVPAMFVDSTRFALAYLPGLDGDFDGKIFAVTNLLNQSKGVIHLCIANGQLNRKIKVIREPKSLMDMVIPCQALFILSK